MPDTMTRPWLCPRDETCPALEHDTVMARRKGCTSPAARDARYRYEKTLRAAGQSRKLDVTGLRRRLEACHYVGWPGTAIAAELGVSMQQVNKMLNGVTKVVFRGTFDRWVPVLERMAMQPPAEPNPYQRRTQHWARCEGFRPVLAWSDIDDPAEQPPPLAEDAPRERPHPMNRTATVEIDEHLLEHVLDPLSTTRFAELSVPEQDHVVERLWRDAVAEGYEYPGKRVAERLEVGYREVETVRSRVTSRRIRERKAS